MHYRFYYIDIDVIDVIMIKSKNKSFFLYLQKDINADHLLW